ncbi:uncharacterized protein PG998_010303 [Apiospora kogelbergensis]|uniref:uncharacterized protein n=1 Tax=Apiospora kogelbergensis TaxID=1337665 RepID=UPI00312DD385
MAEKRTGSYMSDKNGGGDPVTALSLRLESSSQSTAERQAKVEREMAAALGQLYNWRAARNNPASDDRGHTWSWSFVQG